jgi:FkbM family methyltransferase
MKPTITLPLADGVQVAVHDDLRLITRYVLQEQGDWFEDEIRFVRQMLKPGELAIDIGANHGVYALSMARAVGPQGRVWAFEPATEPADLLQQSIVCNGFGQLLLERQAMSSEVGQAQLFVSAHSEQNTLNSMAASMSNAETVPLTTLDACKDRFGWQDIALLKMDAEGEEARILDGGECFLAECSPLIQYELRAGHDIQLHLVQAFARRGYQPYRLIGHLNLLVPFDAAAPLDDFVLNLFACKPDRAQTLAARGLLVLPGAQAIVPAVDAASWRACLLQLPYGQRLAALWDNGMAGGRHDDVAEALALHAHAHRPGVDAAIRLAALQRSLQLFVAAAAQPGPHLHLSSVARVAAELGERSHALRVLGALCEGLQQRRGLGPALPFLAPSVRADLVSPGSSAGAWILSAALEAQERLRAHSSYFTGTASLESLKSLTALGYASVEMHRRLALMQQRFGLSPVHPVPVN